MSVNLKILGGRVAGIALAAVLTALEKSGVPHDRRGCLAVGGVVLVAVVAQAPDLFAAAGIIRPLSPGQASLYGRAVAGVQALIATPAAKRRQKAQALAAQGLQDALADPTTRQFLRAQLWQPGQPVPESSIPPTEVATPDKAEDGGQATSPAAVPTFTGPGTGPGIVTDSPAIAETGGNQ